MPRFARALLDRNHAVGSRGAPRLDFDDISGFLAHDRLSHRRVRSNDLHRLAIDPGHQAAALRGNEVERPRLAMLELDQRGGTSHIVGAAEIPDREIFPHQELTLEFCSALRLSRRGSWLRGPACHAGLRLCSPRGSPPRARLSPLARGLQVPPRDEPGSFLRDVAYPSTVVDNATCLETPFGFLYSV